MRLTDFLAPESITLTLAAEDKPAALRELVALLGLASDTASGVHHLLVKREALGSTGIGGGVAIPHCRSPHAEGLRIAYGRHSAGLAWDAVDGEPVHHLFLIVAPPVELSNQYLPVLGRLAQFCRNSAHLHQLAACREPAGVLVALEAAGA